MRLFLYHILDWTNFVFFLFTLDRCSQRFHQIVRKNLFFFYIFIGPESGHWQCLSVTDSLTNSLTPSCLVNLIDVTLTCEDANSKLVKVVTIADVDAEDHVGSSLFHIWELTFGP